MKALFAKNDRLERVILYGSRAKGTYKPFSDVDITLVGRELTHSDLNRMILDIDDLLLPYMFDISIFHTLKSSDLIDHINRRGIVIYEKDAPELDCTLSGIVDAERELSGENNLT